MSVLHSILISVGTEICPSVSLTQTLTESLSATVIALGSILNEAIFMRGEGEMIITYNRR